jgi:DNA topoisomerase-2
MAKKSTKKTIEETYQQLSDIQHVLTAPDSYVGSIEESVYEDAWVYNETLKRMVKKDLTIVPALYKIFDEVLVNAVDQYTRTKDDPDVKDKVTKIDVTINVEENFISVYNNGKGFDVAMHEEQNKWVPQMILGQLRSGQNYDKTEEKIVGGKNGFGAKLANIFSHLFMIETVDAERGLKYKQTFKNNMSDIGKPKITKCSGKPYTRITYYPDLEKFGLTVINSDIVDYMKRRVYDICACTDKSVDVFLNGKKLEYKDFEKYVSAYIGPKTELKRAYEYVSDRWEIVACLSPDDKAEHVSFVNSIYTRKGGKHIAKLQNHISRKLANLIKKKKKKNDPDVKEQYIKDNLWLFVRCSIVNPSFTGQIKEELETPYTKFGSTCEVSDKFIETLSKCGIIEKAKALSAYKDSVANKMESGEKKGTLRGIPKLTDANKAGTSEAHKCTLILTEGDSAKSSARSGLEAIKNGYDYYGLFPLKGKLLNVRECKKGQDKNNVEIQNIIKIIGLDFKKKYKTEEDIKTLRYGHIMILTDQDVDGSHIKGLFINLIHNYFPDLAKYPGFLCTFATPIIKLIKNTSKLSFYTLTDYNNWKEENDMKGWTVKYYKGLGTSSGKEFQEYFKEIHEKTVSYECGEDGGDCVDTAIKLAFDKSLADKRKEWIMEYNPQEILDINSTHVSYKDFINKDLRHFSVYDNARSIPSICDGFKPSQRKIFFSCLKRNLRKEIKVAQLAGYVSEHSCYHHGEQSLCDAIVGMAQNYVGSNNINLLFPSGQHGTRLMGGKDSASPRYIFTRLEQIVDKLYNQYDCAILNYLDDDGTPVEPDWYCPIIPMILVNGCKGIGTGFSTEVPAFNPVDIIANLKRLIDDKDVIPMTPWFRGFKGEVIKVGKGKFETRGIWKKINSTTIQITELPIGTWTEDYKMFLESMTSTGAKEAEKLMKSKNKKIPKNGVEWYIKTIKENSGETHVDFTVVFKNANVMNKLIKDEGKFEKLFNLRSSKCVGTTNMHLFNDEGKIEKFTSPEDILKSFYYVRMIHYIKRRDYMLKLFEDELRILKNKMMFIRGFIEKKIDILNKDDDEIDIILEEFGLEKLRVGGDKEVGYDYLIRMSIRSLTKKKVIELEKEFNNKDAERKKIEDTSAKQMWKNELDDLNILFK